MHNYRKQIKRQKFKNEFKTIIHLDLPYPDKDEITNDEWKKIIYWKEGDGIYCFDFLQGGDKFITGDFIDLSFLGNLVGDVLERDFQKDWKTQKVKIVERQFFYNIVDYDDDGEEFYPDSSPVPVIFYKILPVIEEED